MECHMVEGPTLRSVPACRAHQSFYACSVYESADSRVADGRKEGRISNRKSAFLDRVRCEPQSVKKSLLVS
ncbi:hypothetical protein BDD14_0514 [Edaphobacter modestus]|uniref:Uncharacterized protein n=1 Tax=Edaphobacter modestus TaxID=388466 RepID=A0A4Q7YNG0_9BACT|nr:hypothetical protein BDD14_0514 [Edaphobacter modestus]